MENEVQLLSLREAGKLMSCSKETVRRLIWSGRLPAMKLKDTDHSSYRILLSDLIDYIEASIQR